MTRQTPRRPVSYDRVRAATVNMRRAGVGPNGARWPRRAHLAYDSLVDHGVDVTGWVEYPTRANEPLRSHEGLRLSRGQANYTDKRTGEKVGNAETWGTGRELHMIDHTRIVSLPFIAGPHGLTRLYQPARLFRTAGGGFVDVITQHSPIRSNEYLNPKTHRPDAGYIAHVREQLCEDVKDFAHVCLREGIPTLVVGDLNNTHVFYDRDPLAVKGAACDVQRIYGYGLDFVPGGSGAVRDGARGIFTDHTGYPYATALVPVYADAPRRIELPR